MALATLERGLEADRPGGEVGVLREYFGVGPLELPSKEVVSLGMEVMVRF